MFLVLTPHFFHLPRGEVKVTSWNADFSDWPDESHPSNLSSLHHKIPIMWNCHSNISFADRWCLSCKVMRRGYKRFWRRCDIHKKSVTCDRWLFVTRWIQMPLLSCSPVWCRLMSHTQGKKSMLCLQKITLLSFSLKLAVMITVWEASWICSYFSFSHERETITIAWPCFFLPCKLWCLPFLVCAAKQ